MLGKSENEWHHINQGRYWEGYGEYDKAASSYRRALDIDPENGTASLRLGMVLYQTGRLGEALGHLERAQDAGSATTEAMYGRSMVLEKMRRYGEAVPLLERILDGDEDHKGARVVLATCLSGMGRHQEAVLALDVILKESPGALLGPVHKEPGAGQDGQKVRVGVLPEYGPKGRLGGLP